MMCYMTIKLLEVAQNIKLRVKYIIKTKSSANIKAAQKLK